MTEAELTRAAKAIARTLKQTNGQAGPWSLARAALVAAYGEEFLSVTGSDLSPEERAKRLHEAARHRAKEIGLSFSLTREWVLARLRHGYCEVTGLPFRSTVVSGLRNNFTPSIDRIDPKLGYTKENCRLVAWIYNAAKGSGSDEDVLLLASALVHTEAQAAEKRLIERQAAAVAFERKAT